MRWLVWSLLLVGCARPEAVALTPAATATALPELTYRLLSGSTWSSRDVAGRVLVLDVWATYCQPCRKSFPELNKLAAMSPDVVVIGLSLDEEDAVVEGFLTEVPAAFPIARDPASSIATSVLAIDRLPTVLVVDRAGRIRYRAAELGPDDYAALPAMVTALLAER